MNFSRINLKQQAYVWATLVTISPIISQKKSRQFVSGDFSFFKETLTRLPRQLMQQQIQ
jgi:hypothetical protein